MTDDTEQDKKAHEYDVALTALNAIDGAMSTLLMARTIIVDRLDKLPGEQRRADPMATMGQKPNDCKHLRTNDHTVMGGRVLTFCDDCGDDLTNAGA